MVDIHVIAILTGIAVLFAALCWISGRYAKSSDQPINAATFWNAKFADPDEAVRDMASPSGADIWGKDGGIYLSESVKGMKAGFEKATHGVLRYVGDRHLMLIGPNGVGKSMRIFLENLLGTTSKFGQCLCGWSVIVVDPKGDLARLSRKHRDTLGKTYILDPFGITGFESDGYNPMAYLDPDKDFVDDAMGLAEAMIRQEGRDTHWSASAQDLVCACIMAECLSYASGGNLDGVRTVLGTRVTHPPKATRSKKGENTEPPKPPGDPSFQDIVKGMMLLAHQHQCPELAVKAARYADITPDSRELLGIISSALTQTRWLDSRPIKKDLSKRPKFRFGDLKKEPITVYLVLPVERLTSHNSWLRLVIASALQDLIRERSDPKCPVLLMLDEWFALAEGDGFPAVSKNFAMLRGLGIKCWMALQDLSQLQQAHGKHFESFIANCGVTQSFQTQDAGTSEFLSKLTGMVTRIVKSSSSSSMKNVSSSEREQGIALMLPQAFREIDPGFNAIFCHKTQGVVRGYAPFPTLPSPAPSAVVKGAATKPHVLT